MQVTFKNTSKQDLYLSLLQVRQQLSTQKTYEEIKAEEFDYLSKYKPIPEIEERNILTSDANNVEQTEEEKEAMNSLQNVLAKFVDPSGYTDIPEPDANNDTEEEYLVEDSEEPEEEWQDESDEEEPEDADWPEEDEEEEEPEDDDWPEEDEEEEEPEDDDWPEEDEEESEEEPEEEWVDDEEESEEEPEDEWVDDEEESEEEDPDIEIGTQEDPEEPISIPQIQKPSIEVEPDVSDALGNFTLDDDVDELLGRNQAELENNKPQTQTSSSIPKLNIPATKKLKPIERLKQDFNNNPQLVPRDPKGLVQRYRGIKFHEIADYYIPKRDLQHAIDNGEVIQRNNRLW